MKQPFHLHSTLLTHRLRTTTLKKMEILVQVLKDQLPHQASYPIITTPSPHAPTYTLRNTPSFAVAVLSRPQLHSLEYTCVLSRPRLHSLGYTCVLSWPRLHALEYTCVLSWPQLHVLKYTCVLCRPRLHALEYNYAAFEVLSPKSQKNSLPTVEDITHHCSPHYTQSPCLPSPPNVVQAPVFTFLNSVLLYRGCVNSVPCGDASRGLG